MSDLGRLLVGGGLLLVVLGGLVMLFGRLGIPLGRLPGDISIQRPGVSFYFPITTSIVVSLVFSAILWLLRR